MQSRQAPPDAETARHYGNMRFAMFTVFTAITGALLVFPFASANAPFLAVPLHKFLLSMVGASLSALFALAECRVSYLVTFYQEVAFNSKSLAMPSGHAFWKWIVTLTMTLPYLFTFVFWILYGLSVINVPASR